MIEAPYLTLVAASRNDDHGGNTLYRTQIFVDSFLEQCERHRIGAELILVEWNPPGDRAPLAEVIRWDHQNAWVDCRVITVPHERHVLIRFGRVLPLFQMIAKNVGIRRARGEFILATNIDILFSEELMARIARKDLRADRLYRCDRFDVDSTISKEVSLDEKLRFAWGNLIRRNHRLAPLAAPQIEGAPLDVVMNTALASGYFELETENGLSALIAKPSIPLQCLHLNACGDFTLLHRDAWAKIGGYAEFEMFSLHLDSLGVVAAHLSGFRETWLPPPAVCFHIEHAIGSGYTAENEVPLFERIERQGIGWFDFQVIESFFEEMREKRMLELNTDAWGLRDIPLDETVCSRDRIEVRKVPEALQADRYAPVTALRPEFNSDRLFRVALRRLVEAFEDERAQFDRWMAETKEGAERAGAWAKEAGAWAERAEAWAKADKARAERAEAWAKEAEARAGTAEAWAKAAVTRAEAGETRAERAEAWAKAAEMRAGAAEAQLGRYRQLFGSLEKLYNKVKFDWLPSARKPPRVLP
jgi:hypothetical protein